MFEENLFKQIQDSNSTYSRYWLSQLHKYSQQPERLNKLKLKISKELEELHARRQLILETKITYPPELPVSQELDNIKEAICQNQVTIICGETGSGKTTQLPKVLLELGFAANGLIGHTQPRRIAARSLATRISQELGYFNHETGLVGYKMRFHDRTSSSTAIKLMTDGVLLQEIQQDKLLLQYSALIIDEVHERSLNIDFILGYLKQLLIKRPELKVIITSATIENEKLENFFAAAKSINVSGKTYPVDIIYQDLAAEDEELGLNQGIYQAISAALSVSYGNGLVFLPGEREIKDCLNFLKKTELRQYELLPLYARQANEAQSLIFNNDGRLKIILATNIAETSLTIPGITFVIDTGLARVKRYSLRNRVEQLQVENVSQASSRQRAGRAGRISHGLCVRLFSEAEFNLRKQFGEPELLRSNLANVILRLLSLNLGDPLNFPFLDMPDSKAFNDGFRTLYQISAIDTDNKITQLGRKLALLPLDVQLGRVLIAASEQFNCLHEALIVVAFLAIQDPREFPLEQQQLARERHSIWADKKSEFLQILNIWNWYQNELSHKKTNKKLVEICRKQFISLTRLREWHELHRQLKETMFGLAYKANNHPATYQELHSAILSGFIVNIGQKDLVEKHYLGTNGRRFYLHPSLQLDASKWMIAANLVETTRLYARNCAGFEPQWLNGIADHLYKYTYHGEEWDSKRGEVTAIKSALLYGLLIYQKRVSISRINPKLAQEVFIKSGLVSNNLAKKYRFIEHNLQVIRELEKLEDKLRTSLALLDDELYTFYARKLSAEVVDIPSLEQFLKEHENSLKINQQEFIERLSNDEKQLELFPDRIFNNGQELKLKYIFDHDSSEDGLVVLIELSQLAMLDENPFEWLVPGIIRDKLSFILKALPKSQRFQFNPIQESITEFLESADNQQNLLSQLVSYALNYKKLNLSHHQLLMIKLPVQLVCHFRVYEQRKLLASGDDLAKLKIELAPLLDKLIVKHSSKEQISQVTDYIPELENLFQEVKLNTGRHGMHGYYSLIVEKDNSVSFGVVENLLKAEVSTRRGLILIYKGLMKEQQKHLQTKKINHFTTIAMALIDVYNKDELATVSANYILNQAISMALANKFPKTEADFRALLITAKSQFANLLPEFSQILFKLAEIYQQIKLAFSSHPLNEVIQLQLDDLIYPGFLQYTKYEFLVNFPRYLQGILIRLSKYSKDASRDRRFEEEIGALYDKWYNCVDDLEAKHKVINPKLYDFKYKIEELRISLFAQELKTLYPVSSKRLLTELEELYINNLT